jgi:ribosome-binding factor A
VEVAADGRQATVFFGSLSPEAMTEDGEIILNEALEGLNNARKFLREKIGPALSLRHIPELFFKIDRGVANTVRVHELLKQIEAEKKSRPPVEESDTNTDSTSSSSDKK